MELANCISVHFKRININAAAAKEKKKNLLKMTTSLGGVLVPGKVDVLLLYNVILIMLCTVKWPNPCLESPVPSKTTMVQV